MQVVMKKVEPDIYDHPVYDTLPFNDQLLLTTKMTGTNGWS